MEGSSVFRPGVGGVESSTMEAQVASGEVVDGFTHVGTTVVSQLRSGQVLHQLPEHEGTTLEEQEKNSDEEDVRLQIEDDDSSSDGDGDGDGVGSTQEGSFFDTNLASMHTYLGEVDDVGSSRLTAQGGSMVTLPMFYLEGIVLFPEQKLPLRVLQPRFKAAVVRAMQQEDNDAPHTLGVIHVRAKHQDQGIIVASVGTTAEIQQLGYCSDGSVNVVTKGRERFQIWRAWTEPDGAVLPLPPMPMWSDCDIMKN